MLILPTYLSTFWTFLAVFLQTAISGYASDHPVPATPFVWPENQPIEQTVVELEAYLEQHVLLAQAGLEPLSVVVDKSKHGPGVCRDQLAENATFLVLCRNEDLHAMLETIQSVNDRYNVRFCHDWVFLNDEPFDEYFITGVSQMVPGGKVSFGQVPSDQWGPPAWVDPGLARARQQALLAKNVYKADSTSYRNMCRYFLGFFFRHSLVLPYRYYWRLEPGVRFYCDTGYDVFRWMRRLQKRYGFTLSLFEYRDTIETLWETSKSYFSQLSLPDNNLIKFVENTDGTYNLCHFWLNFEVADLDFFRSREYLDYFDHLDRSGGFYYERWGDAPVHTLAAAHLLQKSDFHWFGDFGYFHSPYLQCPLGKTYLENRCSCNPAGDFETTGLSCAPLYKDIMGSQ